MVESFVVNKDMFKNNNKQSVKKNSAQKKEHHKATKIVKEKSWSTMPMENESTNPTSATKGKEDHTESMTYPTSQSYRVEWHYCYYSCGSQLGEKQN